MKGVLEFKALYEWMEDLAAAGESVDDAVTELVAENEPFIAQELERQLRRTSEQWTGETAASIQTSGPERDGNYIFVQATAGGSSAPGAQYKEFGSTRQAAEPFFRPTFRGHLLKNRLKASMKRIAEGFGLK